MDTLDRPEMPASPDAEFDTPNAGSNTLTSPTSATTRSAWRRDTAAWRLDLLALVAVLLTVALVGAQAMGLMGGQEGEERVGEDGSPVQDMAQEPTPGPVTLGWDVGIQTWLHWYSIPVGDPQLSRLNDQGFSWVKQRFAWADMQHENPYGDFDYNDPPIDFTQTDAFLDGIERSWPDARVLIQLDYAPDWAHLEDPEPGYSPIDVEVWSEFVYFVASRYRDRIHAFEILNEPNLRHPESWPWAPDPAAYAEMLYFARSAVLAAESDALVISAGLSPTGDNSAYAMPDDVYLEALYDAMELATAGDSDGHSDDYFDALGAHAPGFRAAPEVSPEEAAADPALGGERFFTFRRVEDLRAIMEARGDGHKKIVITELSWTTDTRSESPYAWSAVDPATRTDYLRRALDWAARNWAPWIGPIVLFSAPDREWTEDHEAWWRALTDNRGELTNKLAIWDVAPPTAAEIAGRSNDSAVVLEDDDGRPGDGQGTTGPARGEGDEPPDPDTNGGESAPVTLEIGVGDTPLQVELPTIEDLSVWHGATPSAVAVGDGLLAVAMGHRLRLADVSSPNGPSWLYESEPFPAVIDGLAFDGTLLAVSGAFGVHVFDIGTPSAPQLMQTFDGPMKVIDLDGHEFFATSRSCSDTSDGTNFDEEIANLEDCLTLLRYALDQPGYTEPLTAVSLPADAIWTVHDGLLVIDGGLDLDLVPFLLGTIVVLDLRSPIATDPAALVVVATIEIAEHVRALVPYDGGVLAVGDDAGPDPGGYHELTLAAIDLRDRSAPTLAGTTTIVTMNSTWIGGEGAAVAVIKRDCTHSVCGGSTSIVDVRDPASPTVVDSIQSAAQHLPRFAALSGSVIVSDDGDALVLHTLHQDRDGTTTLQSRGVLPLPLGGRAVAALDADAMVTVGGQRLQVLDVAAEGAAATYGVFHVRGSTDELSCGLNRVWAKDVTVLGQHAYVAAWEAGLVVVDVSDRDAPRQVACLSGKELPDGGTVATDGRHIYVAGSHVHRQQELWTVDVSDPTRPVIVGHTIIGGSERDVGDVLDLAAIDGIVLAAVEPAYGQALHMVDLRDPADPRPLAAPRVENGAATVAVAPGWVALGSAPCDESDVDCQATVSIFRVAEGLGSSSDPSDPSASMLNEVAVLSLPVHANELAFTSIDSANPELWIASEAGSWPVDLSDPEAPYVWEVIAGAVHHIVSLPDGRLLLSGPYGLSENWHTYLWE